MLETTDGTNAEGYCKKCRTPLGISGFCPVCWEREFTESERIRLYQQQPIPCKDDKTITCWHCQSTVCQDALESNKLETRYRCPVCKTTLYEVNRHQGRPGRIRLADSD